MDGAVCQPFGVIEDPATYSLCVPSGCNNADGTPNDANCPSGTHGCVEGICVAPSAAPCVGQDDGADCSFTYGDASVSGKCFDAGTGSICLPTCDVTDPEGSCEVGDAVCQAFGVLEDPATYALCVPSACKDADGNDDDSLCPAGTHGCSDGICVAPSIVPCTTGADGDGNPIFADEEQMDYLNSILTLRRLESFGLTLDFGDSPQESVYLAERSAIRGDLYYFRTLLSDLSVNASFSIDTFLKIFTIEILNFFAKS